MRQDMARCQPWRRPTILQIGVSLRELNAKNWLALTEPSRCSPRSWVKFCEGPEFQEGVFGHWEPSGEHPIQGVNNGFQVDVFILA